MKFYYCCNCHVVVVFNLFDIQKHDLTRPEDTTCILCKEDAAFIPFEGGK